MYLIHAWAATAPRGQWPTPRQNPSMESKIQPRGRGGGGLKRSAGRGPWITLGPTATDVFVIPIWRRCRWRPCRQRGPSMRSAVNRPCKSPRSGPVSSARMGEGLGKSPIILGFLRCVTACIRRTRPDHSDRQCNGHPEQHAMAIREGRVCAKRGSQG